MFKKHSARNNTGRYYWFTVCTIKGKVITTSEMYTTAAMRDKGIEAVKRVVLKACGITKVTVGGTVKLQPVTGKVNLRWLNDQYGVPPALLSKNPTINAPGWKVSEVKRDRRFAKDTFNLENKKGKIVKR